MLKVLDLERLESNLYRGDHGLGTHVFGGESLGQGLVSAAHTVGEGYHLHSMHGYFLRLGDHTRPVVFDVDRIRNGRSFITRRVKAIQQGEAILNLACSFHIDEPGLEHADTPPDVPRPETLPRYPSEAMLREAESRGELGYLYRFEAFDTRHVKSWQTEAGNWCGAHWVRVNEALPDNRALHAILLAYLSDMEFLDLIMEEDIRDTPGYGGGFGDPDVERQWYSLDHSLWFHRPFRVDEWLLFEKESVSAQGARGLVRGRFFNRDGVLVASAVQECLTRQLQPQPSTPSTPSTLQSTEEN
ncbi:MAG: acyl-CoA thioesterase II [Gammaproteobacteria bacterium AqS3]|nr:acyl-CoA thioesterase II [Gammaproteobacteria bacterium AqS3]